VEDALLRVASAGTVATAHAFIDESDFASAPIRDLPHLLFPFGSLPANRFEEFVVEFPHDNTRRNRRVLEMFGVDPTTI
jgi:hypothetical protein